jgi:hypothetical protein
MTHVVEVFVTAVGGVIIDFSFRIIVSVGGFVTLSRMTKIMTFAVGGFFGRNIA